MTIDELHRLIDLVATKYAFGRSNASQTRSIKYMSPQVDMRSNLVYLVEFTSGGGEIHTIHTCNECHDLPQSLFDRRVEWLETPSF